MGVVLIAVEALQITQQKVQVQARLENLDTASTAIRPAPMPPEEHCNTANVEDKADSREDRELQDTSRTQQQTLALTRGTHDVPKEDHTQSGQQTSPVAAH